MDKITDTQIETALKLHSIQGKILRALETLDDPAKRFQVLMAAGVLSGVALDKLVEWSGEKKSDRVVR